MENLTSYQFATLSDISNLSFLFNLVCTPCTLNFIRIQMQDLFLGMPLPKKKVVYNSGINAGINMPFLYIFLQREHLKKETLHIKKS